VHLIGSTYERVAESVRFMLYFFFFQAEDGIRDFHVTGVQTCALPICMRLTSYPKSWGNLEYDVNLILADKAWDANGQLAMDIFDFDGFLGDQMTVNLVYKPFFEVERRKYRFRIQNGAVARFFKISLSDGSPMIYIANDGNLLPCPLV